MHVAKTSRTRPASSIRAGKAVGCPWSDCPRTSVGAAGAEKELAGAFHVLADLVAKGVEGRKLEFGPELEHETDFDGGAAEVGGGVEEMDFEAHLGFGLLEGGAEAEVDDGGLLLIRGERPGGIDAVRREDTSREEQIGGGEAKLPTELVPRDDGAAEAIGTAEQTAAAGQVALAHELPNAGAADRGAVEGDGRDGVDLEAEFAPERLEELDIPGALMAEVESFADAEAGERSEVLRQESNEGIGGLLPEVVGELEDEGGVEPQAGEGVQSLGEGIDEGRGAMRGDDGVWVPVEGDGDGVTVSGPGVREGLLEDALVAQVHPVEHADGGADGLASSVEFLWGG